MTKLTQNQFNEIVESYAAVLEYSDKDSIKINLDELSNEEIEAFKTLEHENYEFILVPGLFVQMSAK